MCQYGKRLNDIFFYELLSGWFYTNSGVFIDVTFIQWILKLVISVRFHCFMAYQTLGVILFKSHPCKETVVIWFNKWLGTRDLSTFPNFISFKVDSLPWLEHEHTYFKAPLQHFIHYAMRTPYFYSWINSFNLRCIVLTHVYFKFA